MANTVFDGDLNEISSRQFEFIADVLNKKGFAGTKVKIEAVGVAGDNYIANVKRIVAEKDGKTLKIVAKVAPKSEQLRFTSSTRLMFSNEYIMYTEVLPKFTEIEKAAEIPVEERLRYATCYGCLMDEPNELILLEDLQVSGFTMVDRFKSLTDENIKLVLKSFAKLHSASYALKYKEPDTFNSLKDKLIDQWLAMSEMESVKYYFTSVEEDAIAILGSEKAKNAIKGVVSRMAEIMAKLSREDAKTRFCVVQQGDAWTNNIMFQLEEEKAVACCMIDYQVAKVNSPVADLHYMIFNCTDYETRSKHFHEWIDYYYSELDKNLSEYGLKSNYVYPRDQLDADLKRHGKGAIAFAVLIATVLTRQAADAAKLKEHMGQENLDIEQVVNANRLISMDEGTISLFKAKVEGVVDSLSELGYL